MKICAVIPAAGRGSRLGLELPKLLVPIAGGATVWSILKDRLKPFVDHIHVVLSPEGAPLFERALVADSDRAMISTSIQAKPTGMGDAVFLGFPVWRQAQLILVIWGDQVHVSAGTIASSLAEHGGRHHCIGLPVVVLDQPYVEYRFDGQGRLAAILQSREGDICSPGGFGDVGTFVLSAAGLDEAWRRYRAGANAGSRTGEANFLPFLVYLSQAGWEIRRHLVNDASEARGINTPEDLEFFRTMYDRHGEKPNILRPGAGKHV